MNAFRDRERARRIVMTEMLLARITELERELDEARASLAKSVPAEKILACANNAIAFLALEGGPGDSHMLAALDGIAMFARELAPNRPKGGR